MVPGKTGLAEYVDEVAPPMGEVQPAPVYHWNVYGIVPPLGYDVRVIACPLSMVGPEGVIRPAVSSESTVNCVSIEFLVTANVAESVTIPFQSNVPPAFVMKVFVDEIEATPVRVLKATEPVIL